MVTSALSAGSAAVTMSSERLSPGSVTPAPSFAAARSLAPAPIGCSLSSPGPGWQHSSPGEPGLPWPILDETAHSCPLVLGGEQPGEVQPLDLEAGVEIYVKPLVDGLLRGAQRDSGAAGIAVHHLPRRLVDLRVRDDLVHQADGERLRGGHEPPGIDNVLGPGRPDQARQPLGAAGPRDDAQQDLRLPDQGAL